jgi:hypothetical protein
LEFKAIMDDLLAIVARQQEFFRQVVDTWSPFRPPTPTITMCCNSRSRGIRRALRDVATMDVNRAAEKRGSP